MLSHPLSFTLIPVLLHCLEATALTPEQLALRKKNDKHYLGQMWMFLGAVFAFFTIVNFCRKLHAFFAERRLSSPTQLDSEKAAPTSSAPRPAPSRMTRVLASISTGFRIVSFRWSLWIGPNNVGSLGELAFILIYISASLIWLFVDCQGLDPDFYKARAGMIATSQLPLVVALANKNNIVSLLTGVSHEKLNILHRASARTVFIFLWIHVIGRSITAFPPRANFTLYYMQAGVAGIAALTAGTFLSLRIFRQAIFEFFFYAHIVLMIIFVLTSFIHVYPLGFGHFVYPAFIVWGLDRAMRLGRTLANSLWRSSKAERAQATVELLAPNTIQLSMKRKFTWMPGQHAYVCIPQLSRLPFEYHPFTIATIPENLDGTSPEEKEVTFLIRPRDGLTKRLKNHVLKNGVGRVTAYIDGPYGLPPRLHHFSTCVLVAGGSGISYTLPLLLELVRRSATGVKSDVRRVKFVWAVRGEGHLPWINKFLSEALAVAKQPLVVDACIYITGQGIAPQAQPTTPRLKEKDSIDYIEPAPSDSFQAKIYHGRPDFRQIMDDEINAAIGPVSVDIAGPFGMTTAIKEVLSSGAATATSVLKGNQPVTLHVETFETFSS